MLRKTDRDLIEPYLKDASNFHGNASLLYIPDNEKELHEIVKECYNNEIKITMSAARTGLTGSAVPLVGAVISMENLNNIISIEPEKQIAVLQPGVVIADFQEELKQFGYFYAPNPTETNSTIGGNVSTAASGARTFKYGSTRDFVKRLKIILANGDTLEIKRGGIFEANGFIEITSDQMNKYTIPVKDIQMPKVKHAAGYYLKKGMDAIDLFIGSEGTLGIITEIEVGIVPVPEKILGLIIFFDVEQKMLDFVNTVRDMSIKNNKCDYDYIKEISARLIEFFDCKSLDLLRTKFPQIPQNSIAAIWIEQEYSGQHEDEILSKWISLISKYSTLVEQTWTAMTDNEHKKLSEFRHELPLQVYELVTQYNSIKIGTDSAVPSAFLEDNYFYIKNQLENSGITYFVWGHIGNSHFHANLLSKNDNELQIAKQIYLNCIAKAIESGGTVSAEHGIGKMKKEYLRQMYSDDKIELMKQIKFSLDSKNLLGFGNLFNS